MSTARLPEGARAAGRVDAAAGRTAFFGLWRRRAARRSGPLRPAQAVRLADLYGDPLYLALDIQRGCQVDHPEHLRTQCLAALDEAGGRALAAGYDAAQVADARYAVCSYLDEAILHSDNPVREFWQVKPLQLELYGENLAGEGFFGRLVTLRHAPEANFRLLELYHLCLMLGFQGRYHLESGEELAHISAGLAQEIGRLRARPATPLAPHAVLRERRRSWRIGVPLWAWPLLLLAGLAAGYHALWQRLHARSAEVAAAVARLDTLAPTAAPDLQSALDTLLSGKTVAFTRGRATLAPEGAAFLDTLLPVLAGEPEARVAIEGHTDSSGPPQANQALSEARARSVVQYLAARGIDAARLSARGFGATRPLADNGTPAGQAANRRIEFRVLPAR
ncbi:type IVB secretion system protein IcmH/DotU [Aquincola sp. MAHUQ-54]|uniref:Type IVB secretion system protein IcmH/DotU n=1 Tax=Aquincola agrisoli TaxID=3119538 RepID=A0AAW9QCP8_9BURK